MQELINEYMVVNRVLCLIPPGLLMKKKLFYTTSIKNKLNESELLCIIYEHDVSSLRTETFISQINPIQTK